MQKNLFIANVEHLKISSDLGHGEKITDKILITNDRLFIENILTPLFYKLAGDLETHYLKTAGAVAYSIEESESFADDEAANSFLLKRLAEVRKETKGTLMKIITLHSLAIVVEGFYASASKTRRTWDTSSCNGTRN